ALTARHENAEPVSAVAAALAAAAARRATATVQPAVPSGWRNLPSGAQRTTYLAGTREISVGYRRTRDGVVVDGDDIAVVSAAPEEVVLDVAGVRHRVAVAAYSTPAGRRLEVDSALGSVSLTEVPRFADPADRVVAGATVAPMPGTVA